MEHTVHLWIVYRDQRIAEGEFQFDGIFGGATVATLPAYAVIQSTIRDATHARLNFGFLPADRGAFGGVDDAGSARGRAAIGTAEAVEDALELRDANDAVFPTRDIQLTDVEGQGLSVLIELIEPL